MSIPSKGVIETLALYPDDRALVSVARRSLRDLVDEIEALRAVVRRVMLDQPIHDDGETEVIGGALRLAPNEIPVVQRALNDRSNREGER